MGKLTFADPEAQKKNEEAQARKGENAIAERVVAEAEEKEKLAAQGGRTDEEITLQVPLIVTLAGKKVEIPLLSWNANKVWRARYREHTKGQCKLRDLKSKYGKPEDISFEALVLTEENTIDDRAELLVLYLELSGMADKSILD